LNPVLRFAASNDTIPVSCNRQLVGQHSSQTLSSLPVAKIEPQSREASRCSRSEFAPRRIDLHKRCIVAGFRVEFHRKGSRFRDLSEAAERFTLYDRQLGAEHANQALEIQSVLEKLFREEIRVSCAVDDVTVLGGHGREWRKRLDVPIEHGLRTGLAHRFDRSAARKGFMMQKLRGRSIVGSGEMLRSTGPRKANRAAMTISTNTNGTNRRSTERFYCCFLRRRSGPYQFFGL